MEEVGKKKNRVIIQLCSLEDLQLTYPKCVSCIQISEVNRGSNHQIFETEEVEAGEGRFSSFVSRKVTSIKDFVGKDFYGAPAEEQLHWRTFLVKLGAENLKGAKNEELFVASHKAVYIVYTMLGDVCIYVVGKDESDELALGKVIFAITSSVKDVCGKPPTESLFLDKYGWICPCHVEIVWTMRKSLNMRNSLSISMGYAPGAH